MLKIIESGYLSFLSKFRTERGILMAMRRKLRRDKRIEEKRRKAFVKYIKYVYELKPTETKKSLSKGVIVILMDEMQKLFDDLKLVIEEDNKLIGDIEQLRQEMLRDIDREMAAHPENAEAAKHYKHLVTEQLNGTIKEFGEELKGCIAIVAGRESLTINKLKLVKDIEAQMQVVEGDLLNARKDLREWQKTEKKAKEFRYAFKQQTQEQQFERSDLFKDTANTSLHSMLKHVLADMMEITQRLIIMLEELHTVAVDLLEKDEPIDINHLDPARGVSLKQLTAQQPAGLGFPSKDGNELKQQLVDLLMWYKVMMERYVGLLRIEESKVEHQVLRAA